MDERKLPPFTEIGSASMACIAAGVVYLAAYLPKHAPLGVAVGFLALAAALIAANLALLARSPGFAWWRFLQVVRWGLLGYAVVGGMLEYTFLYDRTRGALLAVLSCMLLLFVLNVPLLLAFTVARYAPPEPAPG